VEPLRPLHAVLVSVTMSRYWNTLGWMKPTVNWPVELAVRTSMVYVDDLVNLDIPWWTYGAIDAVQQHLESLKGRARLFEFGSGASTVWLG